MPDLNQFYMLDAAAAVVVLLSALMAYMRGFVREVFSLGTWVGAVAATAYFYPQASLFVRRYIETQVAADMAAGVGVFFVSFILLRLVTGSIAEAVASSEHNAIDRTAGFLFGLLRGGLLLVIAFMAFAWFVPRDEQPTWLTEAKVTPLLWEGKRALEGVLPDAWKTSEQKAESLRALDRQAAELERLRRGFNAPLPTVPEIPATGGDSGYTGDARQQIDALSRAMQEVGHDRTGR